LVPYISDAGNQNNKDILYQAIPIIRERLETLDDVIPVAGFFFRDDIEPAIDDLIGDKMTAVESANIARRSYQILSSLPQINKELAEPLMRKLVEELNLSARQVFGILRVAVTGQKISPPLFESMEIIGKDKVLQRLQNAINKLELGGNQL
jgi:glutamyl-tRNA synthetase